MNMFSAKTWFLVAAMFTTCYPGLTASTTYKVGGDMGWSVPEDASYYQNWAANKTFVVGDTLNFNWTKTHDVANVTEADYNACTKVNTVVGYSSPIQIELNTSGAHYYICTVGPHCSLGQKLSITVVEASTSPTTATSPTTTTIPSSASSISLNFFSVHVLSVAYYGAILLLLFV